MKKIIFGLFMVAMIALAGTDTPTSWITNYTYSAGSVSITNTTFTANGATTNDLDASTGDIRAISKALLEEMYDSQVALGTNATTYMVMQKDMKINTSDQLVTVYVITYTSDISTSTIVSE